MGQHWQIKTEMHTTFHSRSSWQIQKAVIFALFLREMRTRFGSRNLGIFWTIVEPASLIIILWVLFSFSMRRTLPGVDPPVFLVTGMLPFFLFRNIITRSMNAFTSNIGLFNYRQVKPIDALIARSIAECLIYFIVYLILIGVATIMGYQTGIEDMVGLGFTIAMFIWFSFSMALVFAVIGAFSDGFKSMVIISQRPLLLASGVFFAASAVPEKYRWILLLNPVLHFLELIRSYYIDGFFSKDASFLYVFFWTVGSFGLGLWLYVNLKEKILSSS
jgi:capsular polysaccharide transport system permease protein